jgi:hypothetical protein
VLRIAADQAAQLRLTSEGIASLPTIHGSLVLGRVAMDLELAHGVVAPLIT